MIQTLAYCSPILLAFALVVTYEYIQRLRRDLAAENASATTAWKLYSDAHRELCAIKGSSVPDPYLPADQQANIKKAGAAPFVPTGIGPTAIADRELRRERLAEAERTAEPPFASPATLNPELARHPSNEAIAAAAREAAGKNGG